MLIFNATAVMIDNDWWLIFGSVIVKLGYGSWLLAILEEKGYDIELSSYYISLQLLIIEQQNNKNDQKDATYNNGMAEINESTKLIIEQMRKYI